MQNQPSQAFPSLAALRAAHNALLQLHRTDGDAPQFLVEVESFLQQGRMTGAFLDDEQERWAAQGLLDYWTATLLGVGRQPPDPMLADFDASQAPELPDVLCPYVGLDPFHENQNHLFFGRLRLVQLLIDKLKEARLLAVVGPSGSGKSSVVLGGLAPALKLGAIPATENTPASDQWRYAPRMVPGSDPLANLARVLETAGAEDAPKHAEWLAEQVAGLKADPHHLTKLVNATGPRGRPTPAVLIVDQFEELFTLCADEATRQAFADNLLALTQDRPAGGHRHTVILTMRTDFESFIMRLPGFQSFFEQALVRVTPLNAAELREAIEKPAELVGLKFEAGVVDALLQDILGEPAALPLLQFTLLKLWEHRDRNRILWEAYQRLGGGRLALARSADELYDSLIPEDQVTARRILLRLVRPGEGLEVTSNRVRRDALYRTGEAHDRVDRVLNKLIAARLLRVSEGDTSADTQVEVAHEALVRNWPRLVDWLEEERESLRERMHVTEAAEQWEKTGRDPGALLRGALLDDALRYTDLNELETEFLRASQEALATIEREREATRQRELEQARALVEEQRQRAESERRWGQFQTQVAGRLRQRALLLTTLSVVAVLLAAIATVFGVQSNNNASAAEANSQEAQSQRANAEAAGTVAAQEAATAQAALTFAVAQAAAAQTAEADARDKAQEAQALLGAIEAAKQSLEQILTSWATPRPEGANVSGAAPPASTPAPTGAGQPPLPSETPTALAPSPSLPLTSITETLTLTDAIMAALADSPPVDLVANLPAIDISLFAEPQTDAPVLATLRGPLQAAVLDVNTNWSQIEAPDGQTGWIRAWLPTYEGNPESLPFELRYLAISNQADVPFTYGQVTGLGDDDGVPLLQDPNDLQSQLVWLPIGAPITLLFEASGAVFGSLNGDNTDDNDLVQCCGVWYFVTLVDPHGENRIWLGYLPAEAIAPYE
jgi:hypothetical protein